MSTVVRSYPVRWRYGFSFYVCRIRLKNVFADLLGNRKEDRRVFWFSEASVLQEILYEQKLCASVSTACSFNEKKNCNIQKEEATSASAGFHVGPISRSNWTYDLEMFIFVEGGKPKNPERETVDARREPATNATICGLISYTNLKTKSPFYVILNNVLIF